MKIKDLQIEIGELYQISRNYSMSDIFFQKPKTLDDYRNGSTTTYYDVANLKKFQKSFHFEIEESLNVDAKKFLIIPRKIEWLKYSKSKIKVLDEQLYLPILEVYCITDNFIFYVKPNILQKVKHGNDYREEIKLDMNQLKKSLLSKLKQKK